MKQNLIIHYKNDRQKCSANFCLNEKQMELFEESEKVCNYWPDLVLDRYAKNTSSRLHRRRINNIIGVYGNSDFEYEKTKQKKQL